MNQHQLKHIPVDEMKVSKLNMRHGRKTPNIDDIYPSILKRGVNQSLLVRREGAKWGVVAGRRRLFALRRKAKETGRAVKGPCIIMRDCDDAAAIEASLLENVARVPADEMQELECYKRLADAGRPIDEIAEIFGITELKVKRVLALASLNDEIRSLYADGEIDVPTIRALTLASPEQQDAWLKLFHDDNEYEPHGERLKAWLTGDARILTDKALFDLETYNGTILTDLFGEQGIFQDPDVFWETQNRAIAEKIEAYKKNGWPNVVILERGEHFASWDYAKRSKTKGGKVFCEVSHDGGVLFHEGYLTKSDAKKIDAILKGEPDEKPAAPAKPEMSGPMTEYIELHRHAATRAALIDHPKIALRLMAAHLVAGNSLWRVGVETGRSRREATAESIAKSPSDQRYREKREAVAKLIGLEDADDFLQGDYYGDELLESLFADFLGRSDNEILRILTIIMGETLLAGSRIAEMTAAVIDVDFEAAWSPDDAFFDLLRDKRVINAMVKEIAGKRTAQSCLTETGKAQKQIIINRIKGVGVEEPQTNWRPRWMAAAPGSYIDGKGCETAENWRAMAGRLPKNSA